MIKLHDGRICLTYGYRSAPFGIRARLSDDGGKTWGKVIILRDDGGSSDLGYPRTIQRPDGEIVTTYYFNEQAETERYISHTLDAITTIFNLEITRSKNMGEYRDNALQYSQLFTQIRR